MNIPLGIMVKDKVTGLIGIAEARMEYLHGCDRYCVQPVMGEDRKIPDDMMVDEPQLEKFGRKPACMVPAPEPKQLVQLGDEVHDPVFDEKGIAIARAVYLNGCARILIGLKKVKSDQSATIWVDEPRLIVKKKKKVASVRSTSGGPVPSCKR